MYHRSNKVCPPRVGDLSSSEKSSTTFVATKLVQSIFYSYIRFKATLATGVALEEAQRNATSKPSHLKMLRPSLNATKPHPPSSFSISRTVYSLSRKNGALLVVAKAETNKANPLFSDKSLAKKSQKSPASGTEAHASTSKNEYPIMSSSIVSNTLLNNIISSKDFERYLSVGLLVAASAVAFSAITATGVNPWEGATTFYQESVTMNPIETKACISGLVYSLGDLIAQFYEGRDLSEMDAPRILRSGLCGLLAHGPLSHLYYVALDHSFAQQTLVPADSWLVTLMKVGIDQTVWSIFWNSTYYVLLGILKMESPAVIAATVKNSWWDLLKAGWRLWPLVHIFTYGAIPVQHRLLFVDAVELLWCSILSVYGQQQRQKLADDGEVPGWVACPLPGVDGEGGDPAEEILRGIQVQNEVVFESASGQRVVMSAEEVYRGVDAGMPIPVQVVSTSSGSSTTSISGM